MLAAAAAEFAALPSCLQMATCGRLGLVPISSASLLFRNAEYEGNEPSANLLLAALMDNHTHVCQVIVQPRWVVTSKRLMAKPPWGI